MSKVVDINKNVPHEVAELMCVHCGYRWIGVFRSDTILKDIVCPKCDIEGFVIETGQILEYDEVICYNCELFLNESCKLHLQKTDYCEYFKVRKDKE